MDEIIYQVINWLSQEHPGRRGTTIYRFEYFVYAVVALAGAVSTRLYIAQRKAFKVRMAQALLLKTLMATSFTEEDGHTVKYVARLCREGAAYRVCVSRQVELGSTQVCSEGLGSLDEVEGYLKRQTCFVLADFGRQV